MPDYREQAAQAVTWRRASCVTIRNPLRGQGVPRIGFEEQDAIRVGERVIAHHVMGGPEGLSAEFDPAAAFPLLDPLTGEASGQQMTHQQFYVAVHSLYMHLAAARDAAEARAAVRPEPPAAP